MRFSILGPLEIRDATCEVELTSPKQRQLLALLIGRYGTSVSSHALVEALWSDQPPASARKALNWHILQLRSVLGSDRIVHVAGGYRLVCSTDELDHLRFEKLIAEAERFATAPDRADELLRQALALWRGPAYGELANGPLQEDALRLDELRLITVEQRGRLKLSLGRHADLIPELTALVGQHPFRQELQRQLMLALYRAGRQSEALAVFREARQRSITELGLEPSRVLRDLERRILAGDPQLDVALDTEAPDDRRPAQLPADMATFTGRSKEIAQVLDAITSTGRRLPIHAIDGMAGVGKTTLAVHIAHRLVDRYPDGQLSIDLQGHSAHGSPVEPASALDQLLRSVGITGRRIPPSLDEKSALWRSVTANRRLLLLLDNAKDEAQVRPLLPGTADALVLLTSRPRLTALDNTRFVELNVMSAQESTELFHGILAEDRERVADTSALDRVIDLCGGLPLATRIAAARLRHHPHWTISMLGDRLSTEHGTVTALSIGDRSVVASISMSYQNLDAPLQNRFSQLAIAPGGTVDTAAAAALFDTSTTSAGAILDDLVGVHLVRQRRPDRYDFHDLIGEYALQTADRLSDVDRVGARRRILHHYLHVAHSAAITLYPGRAPLDLDDVPAPGSGVEFADVDAAHNWFSQWLTAVQDAVTAAADQGWDELACRLAWTLTTFFERKRVLPAWERTAHAAEAAAARLGDSWWLARVNSDLGRVYSLLGNPDSEQRYRTALGHYERCGDTLRVAHTHLNIARIFEDVGDYTSALDELRQAIPRYESLDNQEGVGMVHNMVAWYHTKKDELEQADHHARIAVDRLSRLGVSPAYVAALDTIGHIRYLQGRYEQALGHLELGHRLNREVKNDHMDAVLCAQLGNCHARLGDPSMARRFWQQAIPVLQKHAGVDSTELLELITITATRTGIDPGGSHQPIRP